MDYWKDVPGIDEATTGLFPIPRNGKNGSAALRELRQDLMRASSKLASMGNNGGDKGFKKAEKLVDKARKILFDIQEG